jgi:hypothetical protein
MVPAGCSVLGRLAADALGGSPGAGRWRVLISSAAVRLSLWVEVAAEPGIEPGLRDPNSPVLPLHHSATREAKPRVV